MATLCRSWARARLAALGRWAAAWHRPDMFAGAWGRGAADAAYGTPLALEHCAVLRARFAGGV
eukprot:10206448-Alexandrium_andersonii.AAC.1